MNITLATWGAPLAVSEEGKLGAKVPFDIHIQCKGEDAIVFRVVNGQLDLDVTYENFNLTVSVDQLHVDSISQYNSKIGD